MGRAEGWTLHYLRAWRRAKALSPKELAEKTGISASALSRLEHGKTKAGVKTIDSICTVLGLSREQLLFEDPKSKASAAA
jgi:transcriptional regulator with XRE-family HTH domain